MVVYRPEYTRMALSSSGCLNLLSRRRPMGREQISLPRHHLPRARTLIVMSREKGKAVADSVHGFAALAFSSIICFTATEAEPVSDERRPSLPISNVSYHPCPRFMSRLNNHPFFKVTNYTLFDLHTGLV